MPYVEATIIVPWIKDAVGFLPDALDDISAWAIANDEYLPGGISGFGPFSLYEEINDNITPVLDGLFVAKLTINQNTANQFAADARIHILSRKVFDEDGNETSSNRDAALTAGERTTILNWLEVKGVDRAQVTARFDASDTRAEITNKLKAYFRE